MLINSANAQKRVLYIGDSITDGAWGNSGGSAKSSEQRTHWDLNHIFGHGYMYLCAAEMMAEHPGEYQFFNRGISGNTLADLEVRWQKDVLDLKPDIISILIGTNDVWRALDKNKEVDIKEWTARYDSLITKTKNVLPDVKIVLCTPFVSKVGKIGSNANYPIRKEQVAACAAAVRHLAYKHGATLVSFDDLFNNLTSPSPDYWIWDGIHPTAAGHKKMANMWLNTVK